VQETRGILKTNCRDSLDHLQPMWFQSFRSESSRVRNYCRGVQEIQREFRSIFSETRAGLNIWRNAAPAARLPIRGPTRNSGRRAGDGPRTGPTAVGDGSEMRASKRTFAVCISIADKEDLSIANIQVQVLIPHYCGWT
jgi:hypothetical protein